MDVSKAIQMAAQQGRLAAQSVSEQLGAPREVLSPAAQVSKFRSMSPTQRLVLRNRVGEEEYARYEDAMRQLSARGL